MSLVGSRTVREAQLVYARAVLLLAPVTIVCLISCTSSLAGSTIDLATNTDVLRIDAIDVADRAGVRAAACDINGDGIDDLVVGADRAEPNVPRNDSGEVYVIYGRRGAWSGVSSFATAPNISITGQNATDDLGYGVACGDVNGDGYGDMLLCAPWASRPSGSGLAHLLLGGPSLPSTIDLLTNPGIPIYSGTPSAGGLCTSPEIADMNGDGRLDLILNDHDGPAQSGTNDTGRVYILFGRASWPASIVLNPTGADVIIYGKPDTDDFAFNVAVGDWDGDGKADIASVSRLGDGPNETRTNAGDIYFLRGRTNWPNSIDLASSAPDKFIWGADVSDLAGGAQGLRFGDLDNDGTNELIVGSRTADSVGNSRPDAGEIRIVEHSATLPAQIDLAVRFDRVIWGPTSADQCGTNVFVGDVNGDGVSDLFTDQRFGDGPNDSRTNAGELDVLPGSSSFPSNLDLASSPPDILVYGRFSGDSLGPKALGDLNGDGIKELIASSDVDSNTDLNAVWILSPLDTDNDGVAQLTDNCPLIANPSQIDSNADRRGDACALDYDGDAIPDSLDCNSANPHAGRPLEVPNLRVVGGSISNVTWDAPATADTYDIYRGDVAGLSSSDFGACQNTRDPNLTDTLFIEPRIPDAGRAYFFLVRGKDAECGGAGTLGYLSSGAERVNTNPGACP